MIYDRAVSWNAPELLKIVNDYNDVVVMVIAGHEHGLFLFGNKIYSVNNSKHSQLEINNPLPVYFKVPSPLHFLVPAIVECIPKEGGEGRERADGRPGENAAATIHVFSDRLEIRGIGPISRVPYIVLQLSREQIWPPLNHEQSNCDLNVKNSAATTKQKFMINKNIKLINPWITKFLQGSTKVESKPTPQLKFNISSKH